ncbi:MAG: hypothetical protein ACLTRS_09260 [Lachnospiraceae bacterium]
MKKIQALSQSMDRSRRISNPDKYNEDGTIKRSNHEPWRHSENYLKMSRMLKTLHRKRHDYISWEATDSFVINCRFDS